METRPVRIPHLREKKMRGEKIAVLTAYDAVIARIFDRAGVDALLVGDSVGMAALGFKTTLPVTLDMMVHHTAAGGFQLVGQVLDFGLQALDLIVDGGLQVIGGVMHPVRKLFLDELAGLRAAAGGQQQANDGAEEAADEDAEEELQEGGHNLDPFLD